MKKISHRWQRRSMVVMSISAFVLFVIPFLLSSFSHLLDNPEAAEGMWRIIELRPVRLGLSLLIQACLLVSFFSEEKTETNRTKRMRLRSAGSVVLIMGLAYLILNVLPFEIRDNLYFFIRSFELEYGFSGLVFFSALLLYIIIFKLLNLSLLN